jgi:hypothetical protein
LFPGQELAVWEHSVVSCLASKNWHIEIRKRIPRGCRDYVGILDLDFCRNQESKSNPHAQFQLQVSETRADNIFISYFSGW